MPADEPDRPMLPWRVGSSLVMGTFSLISRAFLFGANKTEVQGLDDFVKILDQRGDIQGRERGLITVSNHVSVLDDPLIWGVLPIRYLFSPDNLRWSLGSYDICFKNKPASVFFSLGQVLPTHRLAYSPFGGLFQPTMTQCIRLLSRRPFRDQGATSVPTRATPPDPSLASPDITSDPFSHCQLTYTTNGIDTFPAPSTYLSRRHSWIHIFPEGKINQHPEKAIRYFKWGIARLILETEPLPQVVPMWISGFDDVMNEARSTPRWLPRPGKTLKVVFGRELDGERLFGELRKRWKDLQARDEQSRLRPCSNSMSSSSSSTVLENSDGGGDGSTDDVNTDQMAIDMDKETSSSSSSLPVGFLTDQLRFGQEAINLRIECTLLIRQEILKLRRDAGWPDE